MTRESIQEREGIEPAQVIQDAYSIARYEACYDIFSAAPLYDRLKKLMLVNANDLSYSDKYKFITADDAIPPSETF
jgi:hypothetical protein